MDSDLVPTNYADLIKDTERLLLAFGSPQIWMRRLTKANGQTRTLSEFLCMVTMLDYHFLGMGIKPSVAAAVAVYFASKMLNVDKVSVYSVAEIIICMD